MVVNAGVSARWVFVSRRQRQRPRNARRLQQRRSPKHLHASQRPVTTGHASAEVAPETNVAAAAAPVYWLDASRLLNQPSTVPPAAQQPSLEERSASSPDPSPSADESPAPARSVVASAGDSLPQTVARAEEPQRIVPIAKPATSIVDDDHTFALLLLMFVTLAIAGPMLHYSERRRRRGAWPGLFRRRDGRRLIPRTNPWPTSRCRLLRLLQLTKAPSPQHRLRPLKPSGWKRLCSSCSTGCKKSIHQCKVLRLQREGRKSK